MVVFGASVKSPRQEASLDNAQAAAEQLLEESRLSALTDLTSEGTSGTSLTGTKGPPPKNPKVRLQGGPPEAWQLPDARHEAHLLIPVSSQPS